MEVGDVLLSVDTVTIQLTHDTVRLPRRLVKPLALNLKNDSASINVSKRVFGVIVSYLIEEIRLNDYWRVNDFVCPADVVNEVVQLSVKLKFNNLIKMIIKGHLDGSVILNQESIRAIYS